MRRISATRETSGETRGHAVTRSERKQGDSGNTRGERKQAQAGAQVRRQQGQTLAWLRASLRTEPQQAKLFEEQSFQNPFNTSSPEDFLTQCFFLVCVLRLEIGCGVFCS